MVEAAPEHARARARQELARRGPLDEGVLSHTLLQPCRFVLAERADPVLPCRIETAQSEESVERWQSPVQTETKDSLFPVLLPQKTSESARPALTLLRA